MRLIFYPRNGIITIEVVMTEKKSKALAWIASSKGDFMQFPEGVRKEMGLVSVCLDLIQSFLYILEHDYVRIDKKSSGYFGRIDANTAPVGG